MRKLRPITTNLREENYIKVYKFLETYNKRTGKDLTMSKFIWGCIKFFISNYVKQSKEV